MDLRRFRITAAFLFFYVVFTGSAFSQVRFGVKTGWSFAEMLTNTTSRALVSGTTQSFKNFPSTGFAGGVFFNIPVFKRWSIQPEFVYSNQGAAGKPVANYIISATETYKFNYLNIPLLIKYKWPVGFFAETGPQLGLLLSARVEEDMVSSSDIRRYDVKKYLRSTDFGWVLGGGYLSPVNIGIDFRYDLGLTDYSKATDKDLEQAPLQSGSLKNSVFQITIFYIF